ncbi:MAG: TRAP transporter substrate-binding protein [Sedimentibacter sp.]|uniref:TRAP transporter substrate-binding protein n=1 Tax=Sedimentibacter sp. TaxID=1960295 RepID=UPI003157F269
MKVRKVMILVSILLFWIFILGGCQKKAETFSVFEEESIDDIKKQSEPKVIILTHSELENSLTHEIALRFKRTLEKDHSDEFEVEIYPNNTLGSLTDGVEYFSNGAVEMRLGSGPSKIISILKWIPSVTEIDTGELNDSLKPGHKLRNLVDEECKNYNCKIIGMTPLIYRMVTSNEEITSKDDFSKINIRVMSNGISKKYWEALGARTDSFNIEQVYVALQQNIVDSQENTVPSIASNRLFEVQKYLTITKHMLNNDVLYINLDFYNSLSREQQVFIEKAAEEAIDYGTSKVTAYLLEGYKKLEAAGVEVNGLPEEEMKKMKDTVKPIVSDYLKNMYGDELYEKVLMTIGN